MQRALYAAKDGSKKAAIVIVYFEKDSDAGQKQFTTIADALRNPPPGYFGASVAQADGSAPEVGDQRRAYVTAKPDGQGYLVWTDVYRFGRAVVVVQLLESGPTNQLAARKAIADKVRSRLG
jgi:hypothetical protein